MVKIERLAHIRLDHSERRAPARSAWRRCHLRGESAIEIWQNLHHVATPIALEAEQLNVRLEHAFCGSNVERPPHGCKPIQRVVGASRTYHKQKVNSSVTSKLCFHNTKKKTRPLQHWEKALVSQKEHHNERWSAMLPWTAPTSSNSEACALWEVLQRA